MATVTTNKSERANGRDGKATKAAGSKQTVLDRKRLTPDIFAMTDDELARHLAAHVSAADVSSSNGPRHQRK